MQTIQVTTYTQCNLIDANMITDLSLSMKVRKIITNLKYNQENARHLKKQMKAYEMETKALPQLGMLSLWISIAYVLMCCIDQATRWSSTYLMITNFLALWEPIKSTILNSKSKAMNQGVMLTDRELEYLRHCQEVLSIFVYGTTKLQAEKYPTL